MNTLLSSHLIESLETRVLFSSHPFRAHIPSPGSLDPSFGNAGMADIEFSTGGGPIVQPDGKILFGPGSGLFRDLPNGTPDLSFGKAGFLKLPTFGQASVYFSQVAIQSDGKIVVANVDENNHLTLARLNNDGSLDPTFGSGGWVNETAFASSSTSTLDLQRDDKILVVIGATVLRFNADGSIDSTFGNDGHVTLGDFYPSSLTLTSDGHLILCGRAPADQSVAFLQLSKLNADGTTDTSFGSSGMLMIADVDFASTPHVLASDDGSVIVTTNSFTGASHITIRRLTSLGSADLSFGHKGTLKIRLGNLGVASCAIAPTAGGKIAVAAGGLIGIPNIGGVGQHAHDVPFRFALFELNHDGRLDHMFGQEGKVSHGAGRGYLGPAIQLVPDAGNKLIVQCNTFLGRFYVR